MMACMIVVIQGDLPLGDTLAESGEGRGGEGMHAGTFPFTFVEVRT